MLTELFNHRFNLAGNPYFKKPMTIYGDRWEIETLFQCLKGRGFRMEETRLITPSRINKMMALRAISFCWSHKMGEWKHKVIKPLQVKKHGRLEQSLFRYGLDYLTDFFILVIISRYFKCDCPNCCDLTQDKKQCAEYHRSSLILTNTLCP